MTDCQLYLITPESLDPATFAPRLAAALDAGPVAAVQLRLKNVDDDTIRRAVDVLQPITHARDVAFIMNDRPDLAVACGCDRSFLLADFLQRPGSRSWMGPGDTGFAIAREGRRATQLGPIVADEESSALSLLKTALAGLSGRVFLDVPERWASLRAWLEQNGFSRQRSFVRMSLGSAPITSVNDRLFVLAGPEFG